MLQPRRCSERLSRDDVYVLKEGEIVVSQIRLGE